MKFINIKGLNDVYPENIEGTNEWYYSKLPSYSTYDFYDAERVVNCGKNFEGMNCILIHYPDGEVHRPFELKENVYVDAPIYFNELLYFLIVDFNNKRIKIVSYNAKNRVKSNLADLPLSDVENCYNLMLKPSPITLIHEPNDGFLNIIWPEKKKIKIRANEIMMFRDNDNLFCSEWYENPEYHERVIVRDWNTGDIKKIIERQMNRMPNGDIWIT